MGSLSLFKSVFICAVAIALASCAGTAMVRTEPGVAVPSGDTVHIRKVSDSALGAYGAKGANPYKARTSLLLKHDQSVFYVYELLIDASESLQFKLVSASMRDAAGAELGVLLSVDEIRQYWSEYRLPEEEAREIQAIIDRTYLGRTDFTFSSRKDRAYLLVFEGKGTMLDSVEARFELSLDGQVVTLVAK